MVKYNKLDLDKVFSALADPTRRHVIASLSKGEMPVSDLAKFHDMSLPGFMKHLAVLEEAGIISRQKAGRVVNCNIETNAMQQAYNWLNKYQNFWTERLDSLGDYLEQEEKTK